MWIFLGILAYILFWLVCIVSYTIYYLTRVIQITSFSQVLYTLNAGAEGAEGTIGAAVMGFFEQYWLVLILGTVVLGVYIYLCIKRHKLKKAGTELFPKKVWNRTFNGASAVSVVLCGCLLANGVATGLDAVGYHEYKENVNRVSDLYEDNFIEPGDVKITFPEKKRNVIHIVMESMESSYTSRENGGGYEEDLIPNLYARTQEGENFTAQDDTAINGALVTNNSGWTVAGLVAQSAAVPLNVGNAAFIHNMQEDVQFMPHLETMGDILEDNGYSNYFMCGSDGAYAGRSNYYRQHGDYEIFDYANAAATGAIPKGYRVWWGFEDQKLYPWAQKKLSEISKKDEPFNFTMLTVDTHFTDGYLCEQCPDTFDSQYKNVINCSDHQLNEFIDWIQQQDFYENTTIVLSGDHLSMDGSVGKNVPMDYQRKAYFTVLNGPEYTQNKTREYCTLDIFPTIIESMGIDIEGHRLGLGTSLYAEQETLIEQMGLIALNADLSANSNYYTNVIMSGDQTNPDAVKDDEPKKDMITQPDGKTYEDNVQNFNDPTYTWQAPIYTPPAVQPPVDEPKPPTGGDSQVPGGGDSQTPGGGDSQTPGGGDSQTPGGGDSQVPGGGDSQTPGGGDGSGSQTPGGGDGTGGDGSGGQNPGGGTGGDGSGGNPGGGEQPPAGGDNPGGGEVPPVNEAVPPAANDIPAGNNEPAVLGV